VSGMYQSATARGGAPDSDLITWPSPQLAKCPYRFYGDLRRDAPVWQSPITGEFLVSRRQEVCTVAEHPERFAQFCATSWSSGLSDHSMAATDSLEHKRKRAAGLSILSPDRLQQYEHRIRSLSHALIDNFASPGVVKLSAEFARPLPVQVLADMLGLPPGDFRRMLEWHGGGDAATAPIINKRELADRNAARGQAWSYVHAELAERASAARDDGLSVWLQRLATEDTWEVHSYLAAEVNFLFFAGASTVTHLIMTAMICLLQTPGMLQHALEDRRVIPRIVEEALRLDSPVQWLNRTAVGDCELAGVSVPAGATLVLMWGSANRDDTHFELPDCFEPNRPRAKTHVALGRGVHHCLGASLARLEARVAIETLLTRLSNLRMAAPLNVDYHAQRTPSEIELAHEPAIQ
jgi:cytochrome P450